MKLFSVNHRPYFLISINSLISPLLLCRPFLAMIVSFQKHVFNDSVGVSKNHNDLKHAEGLFHLGGVK